MGLSTSHKAFSGAYSGFSYWRRKLAIRAGLIGPGQTLFHKAFYDDQTLDDTPIDWDAIGKMTDFKGNWFSQPEDPIFYLLAHSDVDGVIKVEHMIPLADRLEELEEIVDAEFPVWRKPTRAFIDGLRKAAAANEEITFH